MMNNMTFAERLPRKPFPWLVLGGLITAVFFLLYLAPEEATLKSGIRAVYIHVALTWTGMVGFVLAGVLGLVVMVTANKASASWLQTLGWVAFGFYLAGVAMSAVASKVNWGGVFWQEPRMKTALNGLALAAIILIVIMWMPQIRLQGLLQAIIPLSITWMTYRTPLVLHPGNPIFSSEATGIQATFIGMFLLFAAIAAWIIWQFTSAGKP
ncbi:MAG: hypothetical protein KDE56_22470 [Anaerolineales bacterium]|nr:hypothetical protein [Anaerolineales bacterium]